MIAHQEPVGVKKVVQEAGMKVMQERAKGKQMTTSENGGPGKGADRYNEVVRVQQQQQKQEQQQGQEQHHPLSPETSPTSLKFSLSQLWSRQRMFQNHSSATGPMSRPISAPPQVAELHKCDPDVPGRRSSIATLPPSESSYRKHCAGLHNIITPSGRLG
ncbi:hypothetical protein BGZ72_005557 [Mortierella alpina]|nr:hypothetical protein BGZ72_005557 [Mortierella alpina]